MMGWWFVITPDLGDKATLTDQKAATLATWETSVHGTRWIQELVAKGLAKQTRFDGYPLRFLIKAKDVLPLIANGPPKHDGVEIIGDDYVMPGNWMGEVTLHAEKIEACLPDQVLAVDAWDQS